MIPAHEAAVRRLQYLHVSIGLPTCVPSELRQRTQCSEHPFTSQPDAAHTSWSMYFSALACHIRRQRSRNLSGSSGAMTARVYLLPRPPVRGCNTLQRRGYSGLDPAVPSPLVLHQAPDGVRVRHAQVLLDNRKEVQHRPAAFFPAQGRCHHDPRNRLLGPRAVSGET